MLKTALLCLTVLVPQATAAGSIRVDGDVKEPLTLTAAELANMPRQIVTAGTPATTYEGVALRDILTRAGVPSGGDIRGPVLATSVMVTGADGYRAVLALAELDAEFTDRVVLLADKRDGKVLPENAAPFQVIVPGDKRPARWVRQVVGLTVRAR